MKKQIIMPLFLLLAACSSKPSDREINNQFAAKFNSEDDCGIGVQDFKKLNGILVDQNHYEAQISFKYRFHHKKYPGWDGSLDSDKQFNSDEFCPNSGLELVILAASLHCFAMQECNLTLKFLKTDNGWIMQDI